MQLRELEPAWLNGANRVNGTGPNISGQSGWTSRVREHESFNMPTLPLRSLPNIMNDLEKYFRANSGNVIFKWLHYFEIYDNHFARFRGRDITVLEIGVWHGGSLQMWKNYFGEKARIIGIDIDERSKALEEEQIEIYIGDQQDRDFLQGLAEQIGTIDILIDDGGHRMAQQITTFEELFPRISSDGLYVCEDLHTSYWSEYGGGYRKQGTFIEFSKSLIDQLNAWHNRENTPGLEVDDFTQSTFSMHYYDSIMVIEKRERREPKAERSGKKALLD